MLINFQAICLRLPPEMHILIWIGFFAWDYGIGKTKWGSAGGLLIEAPLKKLITWINGIGRPHGP